jgi:YHS domain-containing protein
MTNGAWMLAIPGAVPAQHQPAAAHQHEAQPAAPTPAAAHAHRATPPAAQPQAAAKTPATADPHAGHAAPGRPAAAPAAKPADPHAGHTAPARPAARPAQKPADAHAGHDTAPASPQRTAIADDPKKLVCDAAVNPDDAPTTTYRGKRYYFCTAAERLRFIRNPETYLKEAGIK